MDLTPEQLAAIEARAAKATLGDSFVGLCALIVRIYTDFKDFDGDKRGHWAALEEAVEELRRETGIADIPALTAALRRAWEERDRYRDLVMVLMMNDPDDMATDGVTVLDVWRKDAEALTRGST